MNQVEFQEIGHCGGKITFHVVTDADGHQNYQIGYSHSSPTPAGFFAVYAIPQGVAVDTIQLGGIGTPWNPPPIPGCYPVLIASDSEGCTDINVPDVAAIGVAMVVLEHVLTVDCGTKVTNSSPRHNNNM